MPRFLRQVPDEQRPRDEAPFSTDDQNAKTAALERLMDPMAPNATTGPGGFQQARVLLPGQIVMVRLTSIDELGGGKYWGWRIPNHKVLFDSRDDTIDADLKKEDLGSADSSQEVQVWYLPELGTSAHNLKYDDTFEDDEAYDPDAWDFIVGVVTLKGAYGRPVVIAISSKGVAPLYVKATTILGFGSLTTVYVKAFNEALGDVDPEANEFAVTPAQNHVVGDWFYVTPIGNQANVFLELLQLPIPATKFQVLTTIDDTLKWQYTDARFSG